MCPAYFFTAVATKTDFRKFCLSSFQDLDCLTKIMCDSGFNNFASKGPGTEVKKSIERLRTPFFTRRFLCFVFMCHDAFLALEIQF